MKEEKPGLASKLSGDFNIEVLSYTVKYRSGETTFLVTNLLHP